MVAVAPALPQVETTQDYRDSIAQLRALVPTRGNDVEGWSLLAFHEGQLRNFDAAAKAQAQVIALKGGAAEKSDTYRLLDLMVAAAGGFVSPEAEAQARALYDAESTDHVARYYIGALFNQTDRPDLALRMWRPIVETGDPTTYHVNSAREQIEDAALRAGVRYTLPAPRGPTAMVRSMVASLSNRLATEGGSADEWARLITAYGVLGETTAASEVWLEAKEVFATSNAAMDILRTAATGAGVGP
jgi:cytochrome c-type biogenesis protein CcmH